MGSTSLELPASRHATEPPEARGLRRDEVRLMVSQLDPDMDGTGAPEHLRFDALPRLLRAGDLLVVNASATLNASLAARLADGTAVELHLSTELPGGLRTVEVRALSANGTKPFREPLAGERLDLPACGRATLLAPYPYVGDLAAPSRLWAAVLELPMPLDSYLQRFGTPIRYGYVPQPWPADAYQTVFATAPGSAEMPSAGRPFTRELVSTLFAGGIAIAPSCCTPACRAWKTTNRRTKSASACRARPPIGSIAPTPRADA